MLLLLLFFAFDSLCFWWKQIGCNSRRGVEGSMEGFEECCGVCHSPQIQIQINSKPGLHRTRKRMKEERTGGMTTHACVDRRSDCAHPFVPPSRIESRVRPLVACQWVLRFMRCQPLLLTHRYRRSSQYPTITMHSTPIPPRATYQPFHPFTTACCCCY